MRAGQCGVRVGKISNEKRFAMGMLQPQVVRQRSRIVAVLIQKQIILRHSTLVGRCVDHVNIKSQWSRSRSQGHTTININSRWPYQLQNLVIISFVGNVVCDDVSSTLGHVHQK